MPLSVEEEFMHYLPPSDDPEVQARGRNLTRLLLKKYPELQKELIEGVIEERIEKGIEKGREVIAHIFERRLGRSLSGDERRELRGRFSRLGPERVGDVALDLSPEALAVWLADPGAS